jgi:hypothetical protein
MIGKFGELSYHMKKAAVVLPRHKEPDCYPSEIYPCST